MNQPMQDELRFMRDLMHPWDRLNRLLAQPDIPDLERVCHDANDLLETLKEQPHTWATHCRTTPEALYEKAKSQCEAIQILSSWKSITATHARFEKTMLPKQPEAFWRYALLIDADQGPHDVLIVFRDATAYWMYRASIQVQGRLELASPLG